MHPKYHLDFLMIQKIMDRKNMVVLRDNPLKEKGKSWKILLMINPNNLVSTTIQANMIQPQV